MPKFLIEIKAELANISEFSIISDYDWKFKIECSKCHERDGPVNFKASEDVEHTNSRGSSQLVMKCKFCKSEGYLDIIPKSVTSYTAQDSDQWKQFVIVEGRGWEPVEIIFDEGFKALGTTGTVFEEVILDEDWADYDEAIKESVEIMALEKRISKTK